MTEKEDSDAGASGAGREGIDRPLLGVGMKIAATLLLSSMVALVKLVEDRIPIGQVMFCRAFFGIPPLLVWLHFRPGGMRASLRTGDPFGHVIRAGIGACSMFFWFSAVARLPLPDAQAINFAGPFFTVVLSFLLLGERVRIYRWSAVLVGFLGVLVVLSTHLSGFSGLTDAGGSLGALSALGSAAFGALAMIQVRRLTHSEGTGAIVFYFSFFTSLFALCTLPFGWVVPSATDALILVVMGLAGGIGQVFLTHAYRYAEASIIAPFDYTAMLWVVLIGFFVFNEVPSGLTILGSVIIVASGVFVLLREHRAGHNRSRSRSANTPT